MLSLTAETIIKQTVSIGLLFIQIRNMLWYIFPFFFLYLPYRSISFRLIIEETKYLAESEVDRKKQEIHTENVMRKSNQGCKLLITSVYIRKRIKNGCIIVQYVRCSSIKMNDSTIKIRAQEQQQLVGATVIYFYIQFLQSWMNCHHCSSFITYS